MTQWIKYGIIICISMVTNKTVVDFNGSTYVVAGNIVKRIR